MRLARLAPRQVLFATVGRIIALTLGLLPRRMRFRSAAAFARLIAPSLYLMPLDRRLRQLCAERKILIIDSIAERALYLFLTVITRQGARFDPMCRMESLDLLDAAL